jgi:hypothetical protein
LLARLLGLCVQFEQAISPLPLPSRPVLPAARSAKQRQKPPTPPPEAGISLLSLKLRLQKRDGAAAAAADSAAAAAAAEGAAAAAAAEAAAAAPDAAALGGAAAAGADAAAAAGPEGDEEAGLEVDPDDGDELVVVSQPDVSAQGLGAWEGALRLGWRVCSGLIPGAAKAPWKQVPGCVRRARSLAHCRALRPLPGTPSAQGRRARRDAGDALGGGDGRGGR